MGITFFRLANSLVPEVKKTLFSVTTLINWRHLIVPSINFYTVAAANCLIPFHLESFFNRIKQNCQLYCRLRKPKKGNFNLTPLEASYGTLCHL